MHKHGSNELLMKTMTVNVSASFIGTKFLFESNRFDVFVI